MSLNIENADRGGRIIVRAAEDNSCPVGRPVGVPMGLEVFGYHFARRSAIGRNRIQLRLLAQPAIESDQLAIGRPMRQCGTKRRVAELESLAAVQFASPEYSRADIGCPLPIFREADVVHINSGKEWNDLCEHRVVTNQLPARQCPHHEQLFAIFAGPMTFSSPLPSKDGKKLFVVGALARGELVRYDAMFAEIVPFLSGIDVNDVGFSKDGQWAAYVSAGILWRSKLDGSQRLQLSYPPLGAALPHWSPDGKLIAFYGGLGQKAKLYTVSTDGGTPREMIPEDLQPHWDPHWSPDGTRIVFGGAYDDPSTTIRILDVKTHQISTLPGSKGLFSPSWSPDGRYVKAQPIDSHSLMLFDFATQRWEEIAKVSGGFGTWSKNGDYVYFMTWEDPQSVMRVRIRDRKLERVVDLKNLKQAGHFFNRLALAPDESLLLTRDTGTQEIYALDWQAP